MTRPVFRDEREGGRPLTIDTLVLTNWNGLKPLIQLCALDMLSKTMANL